MLSEMGEVFTAMCNSILSLGMVSCGIRKVQSDGFLISCVLRRHWDVFEMSQVERFFIPEPFHLSIRNDLEVKYGVCW